MSDLSASVSRLREVVEDWRRRYPRGKAGNMNDLTAVLDALERRTEALAAIADDLEDDLIGRDELKILLRRARAALAPTGPSGETGAAQQP